MKADQNTHVNNNNKKSYPHWHIKHALSFQVAASRSCPGDLLRMSKPWILGIYQSTLVHIDASIFQASHPHLLKLLESYLIDKNNMRFFFKKLIIYQLHEHCKRKSWLASFLLILTTFHLLTLQAHSLGASAHGFQLLFGVCCFFVVHYLFDQPRFSDCQSSSCTMPIKEVLPYRNLFHR